MYRTHHSKQLKIAIIGNKIDIFSVRAFTNLTTVHRITNKYQFNFLFMFLGQSNNIPEYTNTMIILNRSGLILYACYTTKVKF